MSAPSPVREAGDIARWPEDWQGIEVATRDAEQTLEEVEGIGCVHATVAWDGDRCTIQMSDTDSFVHWEQMTGRTRYEARYVEYRGRIFTAHILGQVAVLSHWSRRKRQLEPMVTPKMPSITYDTDEITLVGPFRALDTRVWAPASEQDVTDALDEIAAAGCTHDLVAWCGSRCAIRMSSPGSFDRWEHQTSRHRYNAIQVEFMGSTYLAHVTGGIAVLTPAGTE